MTSLYNCKHDGDQYRITKFDRDMNVESSYLVTTYECDCPAAARPTCRHRQMLPKFLQRKAVDQPWFYNFEHGGWVQLTAMSQPQEERGSQYEPEPEAKVTMPSPVADAHIPLDRRGF